MMGRSAISSWTQLIDYWRATMVQQAVESLRLLFLDRKDRLTADNVQHPGAVDHAPQYLREVAKRTR